MNAGHRLIARNAEWTWGAAATARRADFRRSLRFFSQILLACLLAFVACHRVRLDVRDAPADKPISLDRSDRVADTIFLDQERQWFFFFGLMPLEPRQIDNRLLTRLSSERNSRGKLPVRLQKVRITSEMRFSDLTFSLLTLGIFSSRSVTIEGEVVSE